MSISEAAKVTNSEKYGDWYRDPWGWPELSHEYIATISDESTALGFAKGADGKFNFSLTPHFHVFDVPKSYLGIRPAVVLDLRSRLAYAAAVLSTFRKASIELPDWVYGWRLRDGEYANGAAEWELYGQSKAQIAKSDHAAQSDITSFFASVEVAPLLASMRTQVGRTPALSAISSILETHDAMATRSGLPQRSLSSSLLAHLVLRPVDDVISTALASGRLTRARRWMDDISFEGSESALYATILQVQESARKAGLEINGAKTFLTTGKKSYRSLKDDSKRIIKVSKVRARSFDDYEENFTTFINADELSDQESEILRHPQKSTRSRAQLVLRSLANYEMYDRVGEWMAASHYLPHAADGLSRYLSKARHDMWSDEPDLEAWFSDESASKWSTLPWVSAQHALAFSSTELPSLVADVLRDWVRYSRNLQQLAVAVHRLAIADPTFIRATLPGRIDEVHDPLLTRLFAFALLLAEWDVGSVRRALQADPRNSLSLGYLEWRDFKLPKVPPDFDAAHATDTESDTPF